MDDGLDDGVRVEVPPNQVADVALHPGFEVGVFGYAIPEILAVFRKLETRIRQSRQRAGTRIKVTVEKENHIVKLHGEGQPIAAIARLVGLTRRTVYAILNRQAQPS